MKLAVDPSTCNDPNYAKLLTRQIERNYSSFGQRVYILNLAGLDAQALTGVCECLEYKALGQKKRVARHRDFDEWDEDDEGFQKETVRIELNSATNIIVLAGSTLGQPEEASSRDAVREYEMQLLNEKLSNSESSSFVTFFRMSAASPVFTPLALFQAFGQELELEEIALDGLYEKIDTLVPVYDEPAPAGITTAALVVTPKVEKALDSADSSPKASVDATSDEALAFELQARELESSDLPAPVPVEEASPAAPQSAQPAAAPAQTFVPYIPPQPQPVAKGKPGSASRATARPAAKAGPKPAAKAKTQPNKPFVRTTETNRTAKSKNDPAIRISSSGISFSKRQFGKLF